MSAKENTYEVEKILKMRIFKNGERKFKLRWKGFASHHDTWESENDLDCPDLLQAFLENYEKEQQSKQPSKPKTPRKTNNPSRRSERIFLKQ